MRFNTSARLASFASIAIAAASVCSAPASAATAVSVPMAVSATVLSTCVAVTTPMLMGNLGLNGAASTATIIVTCTADVTGYQVGLDKGLGAGATVAVRKMTGAGSTLDYTLSQNSSYTTNWGNTKDVDAAPYNLGVGTTIKTFTVYGKIVDGQQAAAGAYVDTVTVSLLY